MEQVSIARQGVNCAPLILAALKAKEKDIEKPQANRDTPEIAEKPKVIRADYIQREDTEMVNDKVVKETRNNMRGGDGEVTIINWLEDKDKPANVRLAGVLELPGGASIGVHKHEGEAEIFHIISGAGEYYDNGKTVKVKAGDTAVCTSGCEHGIKNIGDEPLILNGFIVLG